MEKLKLGILGFGNMGTGHSNNIATGQTKNVELCAICDISEERRKKAQELYPDVAVFEKAEDMYKSGLIEAVVIAVPHYDHPKYTMMAFENNLHVMVEKPAGVYTKQVIEMNEAAKNTDKKFGIMFNQRTNPLYIKLKNMIDSGMLGNIKKAIWIVTDWYRPDSYHRSGTWRGTWEGEGGGTIMNQNPHNLDLWQWWFGVPDKVTAYCSYGKYHDLECDDDVTAYFQYDNGMVGIYTTSTAEFPGTNRLEVSCDFGKVVIEDGNLTFYKAEMHEREYNEKAQGFGGGNTVWKSELCDKPDMSFNQHSIVLDKFAQDVRNEGKMVAEGIEGINEMLLANAIYMSDWLGNVAVSTKDFDHDKYYEMLKDKIKNSTFKKVTQQQTLNTEGTY